MQLWQPATQENEMLVPRGVSMQWRPTYLCWCVLFEAIEIFSSLEKKRQHNITVGRHSLEILRIALMGKCNPYVTLKNHWSCDSETWGRKSWQRSSTPLAFSGKAEAGNNLTIIIENKPCHAAIRPNSWQPINDDINGGYKHSFVIQLSCKKTKLF